MWINKREYEDMQNKIEELNESVLKLKRLVYNDRGYLFQLMDMYRDKPKATIGDIDNLTFTELAEYVINSKPITRIREHEVVVYPKTEYKEDANNDGND